MEHSNDSKIYMMHQNSVGDKATETKHRRIVKLRDDRVGYVYANEFIESQGIDKIPVYILQDLKPTGEKLLCNPRTLSLLGFLD